MTEAEQHPADRRDAPKDADGPAAAPSPQAAAAPPGAGSASAAADESDAERQAGERQETGVKTIRVQLFRSPWGRLKKHRACVAGLGLRRIGQTVEVEDTPSIRGMINRVKYMVRVIGE